MSGDRDSGRKAKRRKGKGTKIQLTFMHPSMTHFVMLLLLTSPLFIVVGAVLAPLIVWFALAILFILFVVGTASVIRAVDRSRDPARPDYLPAVQRASTNA